MTQVVKIKQESEWTSEQISLIKTTLAKGATEDELKLFLYTAKRLGLDPLAKQIHFSVRTSAKSGERTPTFITSIDGYRLVADRSGLYAGSEDPLFDSEEKPKKATVTVYKMISGQRCPFSASARMDQYKPKPPNDFMWNKMPHLMLGKCAEALALRKAFPAELSGVYAEEEMHQAEPPKEDPPIDPSKTDLLPGKITVNIEPKKPSEQLLPPTKDESLEKKKNQFFAFLGKLGWDYESEAVKKKCGEITKKDSMKLWTMEDAEACTQWAIGEYNTKLADERKAKEISDSKKPSDKIDAKTAAGIWLSIMEKFEGDYNKARKWLSDEGYHLPDDIPKSKFQAFQKKVIAL